MKRVTGIGGIFFKSKQSKETAEWYKKHLGLPTLKDGSTAFEWLEKDDPSEIGYTVWSAFKQDTDYMNPSKSEFMINYRVENLKELMKVLKEEGVEICGEIEEYEYGKFGWIIDPEGRKIELWEPVKGFNF